MVKFLKGSQLIIGEQSLVVLREKDAQFSVSYKPSLGMEIVSYDKNLNVKYRGAEVKMKNKRAVVSKELHPPCLFKS